METSVVGKIIDCVTNLHDALHALERIANNPLPFAYQTHLRVSIWIYLLLLPVSHNRYCIQLNLMPMQFQLYDELHYLTIPGTAFMAFLLLGLLEIGNEMCVSMTQSPLTALAKQRSTARIPSTTMGTTLISTSSV